jgi:hypothetical protein
MLLPLALSSPYRSSLQRASDQHAFPHCTAAAADVGAVTHCRQRRLLRKQLGLDDTEEAEAEDPGAWCDAFLLINNLKKEFNLLLKHS